MMTLEQIANMLDAAARYGQAPGSRDNPGKLGAESTAAINGASHQTDRYIRLSDRMARDIAEALRRHARGDSPRAVELERR